MRAALGRAALAALAAALIVGTLVLRLSVLQTRPFDPDELQHLHATWAVSNGQLPYRDFFEHHMPGLPLLLAGPMAAAGVNVETEGAIAFMFTARKIMWIFAVVAVLLTAILGARLGGWTVGLMGASLLSTSLVFFGRTLEIRPDVPGLAFWVAALASLAVALDPRRPHRAGWLAAAGLSLGSGLVFNQKLLLAGPGLVLLLALPWTGDGRTNSRQAAGNMAVFGGAACVPIGVLMLWFWSADALDDLIRGAFLANLGWPQETTAAATLRWAALRDPFLAAFGAAGFVSAGLRLARRGGRHPAVATLWLPAASLLAGLFAIPAPYPQYLLLVLPALAMLGAAFLWTSISAAHPGSPAAEARGPRLAAAAAGAIVLGIALWISRPFFLHPLVYPMLGSAAAVGTWALARRGATTMAAAVLLASVSVHGLQQLRWMQGLSNDADLARMRFVHDATTADDRVLDGFSGLAWFRPHAGDHPFLHGGIRARLTPADAAGIVSLLEPCESRPRLVLLDEHLKQVSPDLEPAVMRHYQPSSLTPIWIQAPDPACAPRAPGIR